MPNSILTESPVDEADDYRMRRYEAHISNSKKRPNNNINSNVKLQRYVYLYFIRLFMYYSRAVQLYLLQAATASYHLVAGCNTGGVHSGWVWIEAF